jgi:hypothetical protein
VKLAGDYLAQLQRHELPELQRETGLSRRLITKITDLLRAGCVGKAARCLFKPTQVCEGADVLVRLRELHPSEPPLPWSTTPAAVKVFDRDSVTRLLRRRLRRRTAPGPSGWTTEMVLPLLADATAAQGFADMLAFLLSPELDRDTRDELALGTLIALDKNPGVRPIAMGEVFVKCVAHLVLGECVSEVEGVLSQGQYGVGQPGGAERVVHAVREEWSRGSVVVAVDTRNAYNTVLRSAMMQTVQADRRLHALIPFIHLLYTAPSSLLFRTGTVYMPVPSSRGVRQGDVLGPVLFAVTLHPALLRVRRAHPTVQLRAYLDDITLTGDARAVASCFDSVRAELRVLGLELHTDKCDFLLPREAAPNSGEELRSRGLKQCDSAIKILGAFVGDDVVTRTEVDRHTHKYEAFFAALQRPGLAMHAKYQLLQRSVALKMMYLMRTHRPELMAMPCDWFDLQVTRVIQHLLLSPSLCPTHHSQIQFPLGNGGFGLRRTAAECHAAWDASMAMTRGKPPSADPQQIRVDVTNFLLDAPAEDAARLRSCAVSPSWLLSTDILDDRVFITAARRRLGMPPSDVSHFVCKCGVVIEAREAVTHVECCRRVVGYTAVARHDSVLRVFKAAIEAYGFQVVYVKGQYAIDQTDGTVPDVLIMREHGAVTCVDLTIVCATAPTALRRSAIETGAAAAEAARLKHAKHGANAQAHGHEFVAVVLETCGMIGVETMQLVTSLAKECGRVELIDDVLMAMQSELAKANAQLIRLGLGRAMQRVACGQVDGAAVVGAPPGDPSTGATCSLGARESGL